MRQIRCGSRFNYKLAVNTSQFKLAAADEAKYTSFMHLVRVLRRLKFIPEPKLLELYPPFFFMGVKILEVAPNYRRLRLRLPLRWYGRNQYGTMFGGFMCAVSDPLCALLCGKIFVGHEVWTKKHCVDFIKPGVGDLEVRIEFRDQDVAEIERALGEHAKCTHTFEFAFYDSRENKVAVAHNSVFIRRPKPGSNRADPFG